MRNLGTWLATALGLGSLVLALWFLALPESEAAAPPRPPFMLPVTLARIEAGELRPRTQLTGTVRAARRAELAFEVAGTVRELFVEEAEAVEEGVLLARLDRVDEELALASAEAARALSQREHDLLLAGERPEEKRRLAAVLDSAKAEEELAQSEVARGEKLLESRVLSESEQDKRVSELRVAEKRRVAVEEDLARAMAGSRLEDIAIAAARIDEATARLATARHALAKTELFAPWSGRVLRRFLSAGNYADSGAPIYELVDLDHLEIHVDVPARLAERLGPTTNAFVRLPGARSEVFETLLDALVPAADEAARSFRAILRLGPGDDGLAQLRPGQFVEVELLLEPVPDALLVPSDVILAGSNGRYIVRAVAGPSGPDGQPSWVAELVPVVVLAEQGGQSAVAATGGMELAAGEPLVLTGADSAFPGALLLPREEGVAGGER